MNIVDIRQKLHHCIKTANRKKGKAIYALVEDATDKTSENRQDHGFF